MKAATTGHPAMMPRLIAVVFMLAVAALTPLAGAAPKSGSQAQPDLGAAVWHSPASPGAGDTVAIQISVTNLGGRDARASVLDVWLDGALHASLDVPKLAAGSSFEHAFTAVLAGGTHTVEAVADAAGRIKEKDESNNVATHSFTVEERRPDLVVAGVSHAQHYGGDPLRFVIGVSNIGSASASATVMRVHWDDGAPATDVAVPPLAPGETLHVDANRDAMAEGTHELRIEADAMEAVAELDETNNERVHAFTVEPPRPDLVVWDVWWQASNGSLVANVANFGSASAEASTLRFVIDGQSYDEPAPAVPEGAVVNVTIAVALDAGDHNVTVTADVGGVVAELDETNNSLSRIIKTD